MRLLNVETLKLHKFDDESAFPPYAALSHRWGPPIEELAFKDFEDLNKHTSNPGYSKILSACQAAINEGYKWLWVDNVCINHEDMIEKLDTINRLRSIYTKAGVCLQYIQDIPNANINDDDTEILSSESRKSLWLRPEWVPGELTLSPRLVVHAADWSRLGSLGRESLAGTNTDMFGVCQYDESGDDTEHPHVSSAKPFELPSPFTSGSSSQAQGIEKEKRTAQDFTLLQKLYHEILKTRPAPEYSTLGIDNDLRDGGYNSKGVSGIEPSGQTDALILILDKDLMMRNTLKQIIQRTNTARITVDSGYNVYLQECHYDVVFARGEGSPLIDAPSYKPQGTVRILNTSQATSRNSILTVESTSDLDSQATYQIAYRFEKRNVLLKLISETSRVYDNSYRLFFDEKPPSCIKKPSASWLGKPSSSSSISSRGLVQLAGHSNDGPFSSDSLDSYKSMGDRRFTHFSSTKVLECTESPLHNTPSLEALEDNSINGEGSADSPHSSTFDLTIRSHDTRPSTIPTFQLHKPDCGPTVAKNISEQSDEGEISPSVQMREREDPSLPRQAEIRYDDFDTATTYSVDTLSDDPKLQYFQAFIDQLGEDIRAASTGTTLKDVGQDFLDQTLKGFAWRLHEESINPFQLETSVIIHRKRSNIVELLEFEVPTSHEAESESDRSCGSSEVDTEENPSTTLFRKAEDMIIEWIGDVESGSRNDLSQMLEYRQFILGSKAYEWLLTKISQQSRVSGDEPNLMDRIGTTIRNELKSHVPRHKMSRRKSSVKLKVKYTLRLDVIGIMKGSGISSSFDKAFPDMLCFTGSWDEAQAITIAEYMEQTWPHSGRAILTLIQDLISTIEKNGPRRAWTEIFREHSSGLCLLQGTVSPGHDGSARYAISAWGGFYAVAEVGEQIAWLASVFQKHTGFVSTKPSIAHLSTTAIKNMSGDTVGVEGNCFFYFQTTHPETAYYPDQGFCWERLFGSVNIVSGYPILRRSMPKSGLEVSLRNAASIMGSSEVVQWDERLVIKGFNMLMIATRVVSDVMVWHLLVSDKPEERISYVDPSLDDIDVRPSDEMFLRHVEGKRHVIGWCTKATDFCGHSTANREIKPGGLPRAPASIVIDKLYIEGGGPVTAGLMLDINKREQRFWLQREMDYPGLLNWVKFQPVVFYDVGERRAWLVDGAAALLHLVRISLHQDMNDPESAYDWVYDPSKLKDHWPRAGSRQAAIQTLKSYENRTLNIYIVDKHIDPNSVPVTKYSTFEERVKRILHSLEKLIDRQSQTASQDGIKISQTLNPHQGVVGFDIVDIIDPSVPIYPRIQHLNSWGHGWLDLIPTIGITTLFGRGFGDLIRADEPELICPNWRTVPVGKDYLATSMSTMQMLHEKRLLRMEPGLIGGELTKRITWVAAKDSSMQCKCLKRQRSNDAQIAEAECNHSPVQFLAKRWWSRTIPHGLKPVQLGSLDPKGGVIFGHTVLGLRTGERSTSRQADDDGAASTTSGEQTQDASATGSIVSQTTSITVPSVGHSSQDAGSAQQSLGSTNNATGEGKRKRWLKFKDWVKR